MRNLLWILFVFTSGCSLVLDFPENANDEHQYDNLLIEFTGEADLVWNRILDPHTRPYVIATDSTGNIVVVGSYTSTPDLGSGGFIDGGVRGLFAAKLTETGEHIWSKGFGEYHTYDFMVSYGNPESYRIDMVLDSSDNIIITGSFTADTLNFGDGPLTHSQPGGWTDIFIAKLDEDGNQLFANSFGAGPPEDAKDSKDYANSVTTDSQDNIILAGMAEGPMDFGSGPDSDGNFLASFTPDGELSWVTDLDQMCGDFRVATGDEDQIALVGGQMGPADVGGGLIGEELDTYHRGVFIALFDDAGDHLQSESFGMSGVVTGTPVVAARFDNQSQLVVVGTSVVEPDAIDYFYNSYDIFVTKLDANFDPFWTTKIGLARQFVSSNADLDTLVIDDSDNIILSGLHAGPLTFPNGDTLGDSQEGDGFLMKFDTAGNTLWGMSIERGIPDAGDSPLPLSLSYVHTSVALDAANNIIFASGSPVSE